MNDNSDTLTQIINDTIDNDHDNILKKKIEKSLSLIDNIELFNSASLLQNVPIYLVHCKQCNRPCIEHCVICGTISCVDHLIESKFHISDCLYNNNYYIFNINIRKSEYDHVPIYITGRLLIIKKKTSNKKDVIMLKINKHYNLIECIKYIEEKIKEKKFNKMGKDKKDVIVNSYNEIKTENTIVRDTSIIADTSTSEPIIFIKVDDTININMLILKYKDKKIRVALKVFVDALEKLSKENKSDVEEYFKELEICGTILPTMVTFTVKDGTNLYSKITWKIRITSIIKSMDNINTNNPQSEFICDKTNAEIFINELENAIGSIN
ncbi:hypothetical protein [Alphaentomopoxvirus acuprea]|uniref:Uncharacterized protein n=1 Tax=Alphaentomopoxvirus acuprea TaxID=62099 RepID=W6JIV9_9POXV|nr:hypothetical protein BA82_gp132 [Anomala cuprea entomopoxvirus]BAO49492.1 hypothetical protein [Anomala cuprea entomopoxvirus]